ncbi:glutamate receptor ionotropic, kainate 2-like isoform X2 [Amphibalanus amphitrite]|uniref:glutamate receptor ionotropic, kainate 2-like isoform X2 n=1 Tax=Amphibalanus amphitrite TaxID=1232801 RepID=UPI001C927077|nr:glutamate receptor ionotropic, kainate 2-like isoform X2 [Amphibalanus amphitrite]
MAPVTAAALLVFLLAATPAAGYYNVTIGGLFYNEEGRPNEPSFQEEVFRQAVKRISSKYRPYTFSHRVERLSGRDSLPASRQVCATLAEVGMAAIFGPGLEPASGHIQAICDAKAIPHIQTHPRDVGGRRQFSINLHPQPAMLRKAFAEILAKNHWEFFAVLYEDNTSLLRLQELLQLASFRPELRMVVRQLPADEHYRHLLRQLMHDEVRHVVLDCDIKSVPLVLKQAQQIGMMTAEYSFFITSLDLHTVNLVDFQYSGANITGLRLINPRAQDISGLQPRGRLLKTEEALLYDSVMLFAEAFYDLMNPMEATIPPLDCKKDNIWMHGDSLINFMRRVENRNGLTGRIEFDTEGQRSQFSLDLLELSDSGLTERGTWTPSGLNISKRVAAAAKAGNRTLIVTTILKAPYTMYKETSTQQQGNDRFEGICVDIIDELAKELNFNYSFRLNPDDTPGREDPVTGKWNGMIGELLDGKAQLAITDLTITKARQEVVEFTMQWLSLGIGLLYTKPVKQPPNLFSFLSPLSLEVWIYIALAYLGVSVLMFLLARFSPYEWVNPHPCNDEPEELENEVNIRNGCWFTIGSLMQQGSDIAPKAVSTRMVAGSWWFFTLIMVSSYTANLAAFLTVETLVSPISSAEDLARQSEIKYGVQEGGSTASFFKQSRTYPFDKMWKVMEDAEPSVFEKTKAGIDRVSEEAGKYAYFMESSTIEYNIERRCDLTMVGGLLDNKGYGIAVGKTSPVSASELTEVILKMQEDGRLQRLKTMWWKNKKDGGKCDEQVAKGNVAALTLKNVGGVFVCLMCGMALAVIQSCLEFIWAVRQQAAEENVPFASEVMKDLSFVFRFRGNTKPVRRPITSDEDEATIPFSTNSSGQYAASGYGYNNRT